MGEIKQTNFRIDEEVANAFRKYCEDNEISQSQGFAHLLELTSLEQNSSRTHDIQKFKYHIDEMAKLFEQSIKYEVEATEIAKQNYNEAITEYEEQIKELKEINANLLAENEKLVAQVKEIKEVNTDIKANNEKLVTEVAELKAEKKTLASVNKRLESEHAELEKKAIDYDTLKLNYNNSQSLITDYETNIKLLKKDIEMQQSKNDELEKRKEELQAQILEQRAEIKSVEQESKEIKDALLVRDKSIASLNSKIEYQERYIKDLKKQISKFEKAEKEQNQEDV